VQIEQLYEKYCAHPEVITDTRKLKVGGIYFALRGGNFDGNKFAAAAIAGGAAYAVIDDAQYAADERYIVVADVLETLQALARHHRRQCAVPVIAITGSNGKTTTKELVASVLAAKYTTYATEGNLNNHIGVPLTLLRVKKDVEMVVVEMGANHQKEIAGYCKIAEPNYGLITNCGKAHIEGFGGEEGVRKGKGELYDYLRANDGIVFRNTDLDYLNAMSTGIASQVTYGTKEGGCTGIPEMDGVFLGVQVKTDEVTEHISTQLVGVYNSANVMTAVAVGLHFGVPMPAIKKAIEEYVPDNSRSQWVQKGSNKLILDAYNANPTSMKAAIENFAATDLKNKVLWIGAMKEMGEAMQAEHQALVDLISSYAWQQVILVGDEFKTTMHPYQWYADSKDAASEIMHKMPVDSAILIKGSRGSKMELMAAALV
jgi:UDP-N-acetylmuramoyl-tripeptide--D-alanyl-D-alanine ligase